MFQASATGGLGSVKAEVMADTAVALASANVQVVSRKVIGRLDSVRRSPLVPSLVIVLILMTRSTLLLITVCLQKVGYRVISYMIPIFLSQLISKTFISPTVRLEQHLMWDDIAILTRYLLMLSFNDCLDGERFLLLKQSAANGKNLIFVSCL